MFGGGHDNEPDEKQTKELQSFMETEQQKAVIQAAISKLTETCFDTCVNKPGNKLDSSEANCIANCAGRYLDSSVFVVNRMMAKRAGQ
jgi:import inner membrane translocase subunit TIM8